MSVPSVLVYLYKEQEGFLSLFTWLTSLLCCDILRVLALLIQFACPIADFLRKGYIMPIPIRPRKTRKHIKDAKGNLSRRKLSKPAVFVLVILFLSLSLLVANQIAKGPSRQINHPKVAKLAKIQMPSWIDRKILPEESDSRRGVLLEDFGGIVIHYIGNPGSTAQQNRDFYANEGIYVNSHFIVGLEGEIIQCLPLEEKSSASNERNRDTISIEVCHPDAGGKFLEKTYNALIRLTAWLCRETGITESSVIRHYDVTGKECPLYYVTNPDAWRTLLQDVGQGIHS